MALSPFSLQRSLLALAAAAALATLAACGGGADAPSEGAVKFVAQMRALAVQAEVAAPVNPKAAAVASTATGAALTTSVTADMVLDWAEFKFASLFPKLVVQKFPAVVYAGVTYNARAYSGPWGTRYIGITPDGRIFGLGDFTNNLLQAFETVAFWAAQVDADRCAVTPSSCVGTATPPAGPLNDCTLPAAQALATGSRFLATYALSGSITGQLTIDSLVQGAGTFEGQNAVKTLNKIETSASSQGVTITSKNDATSYEQDGGNGFTKSLGSEASVSTGGVTVPGVGTVGGSVSLIKTVYSPAGLNVEFSIQPGQSIKKESAILSTVDGRVQPLFSSSTTFTFVAREQVVVRGRNFSTCKYTQTDGSGSGITTTWHILNRGVAAKTETTTTINGKTNTDLTELVQGSFNGTPL